MRYTVFCRETGKAVRLYQGGSPSLIVTSPTEVVVEGSFWPDYRLDVRSDDMGAELLVPVPCAPEPKPWEEVTLDTGSDTPRWVTSQSLTSAQGAAWTKIKVARSAANASPILVGGMLFDVKGDSLSLLSSKVQAMTFLEERETLWTLADNTQALVSASDLVRVVSGFSRRADLLHQVSVDLRGRIDRAASAEEALAVVWPAELPSLDF